MPVSGQLYCLSSELLVHEVNKQNKTKNIRMHFALLNLDHAFQIRAKLKLRPFMLWLAFM